MTASDDLVDFVRIGRDLTTGAPAAIFILDASDQVAQDLSPDLARAAARRLDALADEYERHKPLRRRVALDEKLRSMDE